MPWYFNLPGRTGGWYHPAAFSEPFPGEAFAQLPKADLAGVGHLMHFYRLNT